MTKDPGETLKGSPEVQGRFKKKSLYGKDLTNKKKNHIARFIWLLAQTGPILEEVIFSTTVPALEACSECL